MFRFPDADLLFVFAINPEVHCRALLWRIYRRALHLIYLNLLLRLLLYSILHINILIRIVLWQFVTFIQRLLILYLFDLLFLSSFKFGFSSCCLLLSHPHVLIHSLPLKISYFLFFKLPLFFKLLLLLLDLQLFLLFLLLSFLLSLQLLLFQELLLLFSFELLFSHTLLAWLALRRLELRLRFRRVRFRYPLSRGRILHLNFRRLVLLPVLNTLRSNNHFMGLLIISIRFHFLRLLRFHLCLQWLRLSRLL